MKSFSYDGIGYVRPLSRGVILGDPADGTYLDGIVEDMLEDEGDLYGGSYINIKVFIEVKKIDDPSK